MKSHINAMGCANVAEKRSIDRKHKDPIEQIDGEREREKKSSKSNGNRIFS